MFKLKLLRISIFCYALLFILVFLICFSVNQIDLFIKFYSTGHSTFSLKYVFAHFINLLYFFSPYINFIVIVIIEKYLIDNKIMDFFLINGMSRKKIYRMILLLIIILNLFIVSFSDFYLFSNSKYLYIESIDSNLHQYNMQLSDCKSNYYFFNDIQESNNEIITKFNYIFMSTNLLIYNNLGSYSSGKFIFISNYCYNLNNNTVSTISSIKLDFNDFKLIRNVKYFPENHLPIFFYYMLFDHSTEYSFLVNKEVIHKIKIDVITRIKLLFLFILICRLFLLQTPLYFKLHIGYLLIFLFIELICFLIINNII